MGIVINSWYGGFTLSSEAISLYEKYTGKSDVQEYDIPRDDPYLVQVVRELGDNANGLDAELRIVTIPDDVVDWYIHDYDGLEEIHEAHRSWG